MKTAIAVIVLALGLIAPPAVAKAPPGNTLVVRVTGVTGARVTVTGPQAYRKTVRIDDRRRLKGLTPGRYTVTAQPVGDTRATEPKQTVRVRKSKGARVRFRYVPPDTTAPPPVTDLQVASLTSTTVRLTWKTPPDGTFLFINVIRSGGTDAETGEPVLDRDGRGLSDSGLVPNTEYTYSVSAKDEAGNVSVPTKITVRTLVG